MTDKQASGVRKSDAPAGETESTVLRRVREMEVVNCDRIEMMEAANDLVDTICNRMVTQATMDVHHEVLELTEREQAAYNAALAFLERQFRDGYRDTDVVETRIESESNCG